MSDTITLKWTEEIEDKEIPEDSDDRWSEVEFEEDFPAKMEVCGRCDGHGTHMNESMGSYGYSAEEFDRDFDDDEKEEYFKRGGIYDVTCTECKGRNVVPVVNESLFTAEQKAMYARFVEYDEERAQSDAEFEAESRMERLMGC